MKENTEDSYFTEIAEARIEQALLKHEYVKYKVDSTANNEEYFVLK